MPEVPTVAKDVFADDHVPPVTALVNVVVPPAQTDAVPPIAAGCVNTFTVKNADVPQPVV
jgi:hypothetical protein